MREIKNKTDINVFAGCRSTAALSPSLSLFWFWFWPVIELTYAHSQFRHWRRPNGWHKLSAMSSSSSDDKQTADAKSFCAYCNDIIVVIVIICLTLLLCETCIRSLISLFSSVSDRKRVENKRKINYFLSYLLLLLIAHFGWSKIKEWKREHPMVN